MGSGMCIRGVRGRGLGLRGDCYDLYCKCVWIIVGGVESLSVGGYVYVRNAFFVCHGAPGVCIWHVRLLV